ncbi:MAG: Na-K-Cl cotransporter [Myxococcota bacterium]
MTEDASKASDSYPNATEPSGRSFGTFQGVFRPTILTILGAMLYLREGWVVGQAGLGGFIIILVGIYLITTTTALSMSSITTNIRIGQGGVFSIIAQSMGLEAGGAIGVPFYLAQSLSGALYIFAFAEGWALLFPDHPMLVVVAVVYVAVLLLSFAGSWLAFRAQSVILVGLVLVLGSVALGLGNRSQDHVIAFWSQTSDTSLTTLFALFFPAATGILVGASMSGALTHPRRSIPRGTLAAVFTSFTVYLLLGIWFAAVATPEELRSNYTIMADRVAWRPAFLIGLLSSTFSAALSSLVAAPQVLNALGTSDIIPGGRPFFAADNGGEPRRALLLTAVILGLGLLSGSLDAIAPLLTVFFLITYASINVVLLVEQSLGLPSFRPTFKVPIAVPLLGSIASMLAILATSPIFGLVALIFVLIIYVGLVSRRLDTPYETVRSGLFVNLAGWAARKVASLPDSTERSWKPDLLVPVQTMAELTGIFRLLRALTAPKGSVKVVGLATEPDTEFPRGDLQALTADFEQDGVYASTSAMAAPDYGRGTVYSMAILAGGFFPPNVVFINLHGKQMEYLMAIQAEARLHQVGLAIYAGHAEAGLGRERVINLWVRDQSPDWKLSLKMASIDLSLLLALQLQQSWRGARMRLICVVNNEAKAEDARRYLEELGEEARIPGHTEIVVTVGSFSATVDQAPRADINMFGLPPDLDTAWMTGMTARTNTSCIFVRAGGKESALA